MTGSHSTTAKGRRVVLITGASSGIGFRTAMELLRHGHAVYAAARRREAMDPIVAAGGVAASVDVTDEDALRRFVRDIEETEGRLDVVVCNAGYGEYGVVESVPMDRIRRQFDVNVFGVGRTVQAALPMMRRQRSGRIVIVGSMLGRISGGALGWYAATKHALVAISTALRQEVGALGIVVTLVEPGALRTGFDGVALEGLRNRRIPDYGPLADGFARYTANLYGRCPPPDSTVKAIIHAATAGRPRSRYRPTMDARVLPVVAWLLPARLYDRVFLRAYRVGRAPRS